MDLGVEMHLHSHKVKLWKLTTQAVKWEHTFDWALLCSLRSGASGGGAVSDELSEKEAEGDELSEGEAKKGEPKEVGEVKAATKGAKRGAGLKEASGGELK